MFITKHEDSYTLNWTSRYTDADNKEHHEWFELELKEDFICCLKELG